MIGTNIIPDFIEISLLILGAAALVYLYYRSKLEGLRTNVGQTNERLEKQRTQHNYLIEENARLDEENERLKNQMNMVSEENEEVLQKTRTLSQTKQIQEVTINKLQTYKTENDELATLLKDAEGQLTMFARQLNQQRQKNQQLEIKLQDKNALQAQQKLAQAMSSSNKSSSVMSAEVQELQTQLRGLQQANLAYKKAVSALETIQQNNQMLQTRVAELEVFKSRYYELTIELEKLKMQ